MGINITRLTLVAGVCVILAACGGGGDNGSSASAVTLPGGGSNSGATLPDGDASASGTGESKPTISGNPPAAVLPDNPYMFQPQAKDGDGDVLTFRVQNAPQWIQFDATTGKLHGTPGVGDIGTYPNIVISVTDGAADAALQAFSITVQPVGDSSVELSWQAPTQNEDGTPLTDLAGYKLYWGTTPGEYPSSITIDNPGVLTYVLDNLVPNTYYFVATALNTEGTESSPSDMATVTL
ncbi:MAG TPA: putative Ig domain-containing protein [Gammaproteobacteria bacterium]|nr:putative Ig domain-containing protein [Gammaproteobacteria bacterium]